MKKKIKKKNKKRRNPSASMEKLPNKIPDEDNPILETIKGYKKTFYGKIFNELIELKGIWISDLNRFRNNAVKPVTAYYVGMSIRYDNYYLHFLFIYDNFVYAFAWETPFDEWHRIFDKKIRFWYDSIKENMSFQIVINPDNPAQFCIADNNFKMNGGVIFLGKWDSLFKKNTISYEARKLGIPAYRFRGFTLPLLWHILKYEIYYIKSVI
jgi:hypothetical protein